jgi:lauroyl/myristoyl acyltransferase
VSQTPVAPALRLKRLRRRAVFVTLRTIVRALGFERMRALGYFVGTLQFLLSYRSRRRWQREIATLLGRAPDDRSARDLLLQSYRTNTRALLEITAMLARPQDPAVLRACAEVEGIDTLRVALAQGRGAILLASHMGNGLLSLLHLAHAGIPVTVVYKESRMMDAGFFDKNIPHYGVQGILANDGFKAYSQMLGALRAGRVVYVMADQGTKKAEDGIVLRFLGKDLSMPAGPAQLARHSRAPVLPVVTVAAEPRWRFEIGVPVVLQKGASLEADVEMLLRVTEQQILQYPELWSWHYRRWRQHGLAALR